MNYILFSCIRSRISRILLIFGLSKGDQWSLLRRPLGRKPRTPWPSYISHRTHRHISFVTTLSVSSVSSVCPFRTSIRVIRAECGAETHSASSLTHRYPFNLGYPWSANPFSSFSSFRLFSELPWGPDGFSARSAIFCRYWTCTFSGSQARLLMPVPHFHPTFNVVATLKISQNIIEKSFKWGLLDFIEDFWKILSVATNVPRLSAIFTCLVSMSCRSPYTTQVCKSLRSKAYAEMA